MVQMGDSVAVERCVQHLNNIPVGTGGKIQIAFSKQNFLSEVINPFLLPDHTPSFKEYTGSKNNRFLSPAQASKNRIQPPSKVRMHNQPLHAFNINILHFLVLDLALLQHTARPDRGSAYRYLQHQGGASHLSAPVPLEDGALLIGPDRIPQHLAGCAGHHEVQPSAY